MSGLVMVEQRRGESDGGAPWILDRHGRQMRGHDDERRTSELRSGLTRHAGVSTASADASSERVEQIVGKLHERDYIEALKGVNSEDPELMPEWAPPGLPADSPVWAGVVSTAFEGVRTAITAAERIVDGARFTYALCRPPGHHAGPAWLGGYCYLNTAGVAAQTLCEGGVKPVAILDLDFHFPTGTSAIVAGMRDTSLHSLHASTMENVPWREVIADSERERFVEFTSPPGSKEYLEALASSIDGLRNRASALVLSLGYDTVAGDPHGSWNFSPEIFTQVGRLLAASGMPVCVIQEGGYALDALAACSHAFASGLLEGCPQ
jgi:acetoin utilization deacetylase AcuC-like enzyme